LDGIEQKTLNCGSYHGQEDTLHDLPGMNFSFQGERHTVSAFHSVWTSLVFYVSRHISNWCNANFSSISLDSNAFCSTKCIKWTYNREVICFRSVHIFCIRNYALNLLKFCYLEVSKVCRANFVSLPSGPLWSLFYVGLRLSRVSFVKNCSS